MRCQKKTKQRVGRSLAGIEEYPDIQKEKKTWKNGIPTYSFFFFVY